MSYSSLFQSGLRGRPVLEDDMPADDDESTHASMADSMMDSPSRTSRRSAHRVSVSHHRDLTMDRRTPDGSPSHKHSSKTRRASPRRSSWSPFSPKSKPNPYHDSHSFAEHGAALPDGASTRSSRRSSIVTLTRPQSPLSTTRPMQSVVVKPSSYPSYHQQSVPPPSPPPPHPIPNLPPSRSNSISSKTKVSKKSKRQSLSWLSMTDSPLEAIPDTETIIMPYPISNHTPTPTSSSFAPSISYSPQFHYRPPEETPALPHVQTTLLRGRSASKTKKDAISPDTSPQQTQKPSKMGFFQRLFSFQKSPKKERKSYL